MMAYSNNSKHISSEFSTSVPFLASASASAWGTWHTQGLVHTNCGPQMCNLPSLDAPDSHHSDATQVDATPNEYNQCVFIRYYTMRRRVLVFPKVMKAAAGPHDPGSGNNRDEALPKVTVQSSSDPDAGSGSTDDSMMGSSSSVTSHDSGLEPFNNASSVRRSPLSRLPVLTSLIIRRKTICLISSRNMFSKRVILVYTCNRRKR